MKFIDFYYILEGGKALSGTSKIEQKDIPDTLKDLEFLVLKKLGNLKKGETWDLGGSALKKSSPSGDLDIIIDQNAIDTKGQPVLDYLYDVVNRLGLQSVLMRGLGIVSVAFPIHGTDRKVQIDLMPTDNFEFTKWSYHSPYEKETRFKTNMGTYRTELLKAIAAEIEKEVIDKFPTEEPKTVKRLALSSDKGLSRKIISYAGKKNNILKNPIDIEKTLISKDPNEIIKILLGPNTTKEDTQSFETIYKKMMSPDFPYKDKIPQIKKNYINRLKEKNLEIPGEFL
ncbi:MAG: hypothetical protein QXG00_07015 [Candidatus Woesearchaeota archaeon]